MWDQTGEVLKEVDEGVDHQVFDLVTMKYLIGFVSNIVMKGL